MSGDRVEWFLNQAFRYRGLLQRYLRKRLRSEDDVEDIIQETYLRLYSLQDYEAVESPKSLLIKIAHNLAVELIRKRYRQATDTVADFGELSVSSMGGSSLDEQLHTRQRLEAFCAAVDSLPPICRRAFVLRKVYNLSQVEISAVLGISASTIEKHVAKGLIRCRAYFREHGLLEEVSQTAALTKPCEAKEESDRS